MRWVNDLPVHRPDLTENPEVMKRIIIRTPLQLSSKGLEDPTATWVNMQQIITEWPKNKPTLIIIDGMTGFRGMAVDMWRQKSAALAPKDGKPKQPGEDRMTIQDYAWVNTQLEILQKRMIFFARTTGAQLYVAAHLKELYETGGPLGFGKKTGDTEIDAPKMLKAWCDEIAQIIHEPTGSPTGKEMWMYYPVKSQFGSDPVDVSRLPFAVIP